MGRRGPRRDDRGGRPGLCGSCRRGLGRRSGHGQDPPPVPGRIQPGTEHDEQRDVHLGRALAAGVHPRRTAGFLSLAGRLRHCLAGGLVAVSRRLQLLPASATRSRAPPCWPASAIPAPPWEASSRSTWPCIAPVSRPSCTWAAPRPGGCGAVDPALFDQFWTKTIRFVAQEHLLQAVVAGLALDRSRPIQCGQLRWKCGRN